MARATGRAAVCLGTSGPGATNLLTPIADAKLDSVPLIAITGQVPTALIGTDAFQEVDTYGLTVPITKHNFLVRRASDLLEIVPRAFEIAESGRAGPVVVDVPKDVQMEEVDFASWPAPWSKPPPAPVAGSAISSLAEMIHASRRPVILAGGGVIAAEASQDLASIARRNSIPVALTLAGLGVFPPDDPLYLGMLGMHGARYTNLLLEEADLLVAIGVRFDDRATGKVEEFCRRAAIAHIEIDPSEIGKIKKVDLAIEADAGEAMRALKPLLRLDRRREWRRQVARLKADHPLLFPVDDDLRSPLNFIRRLAALLEPETVITTDVGQHQMWVAQAYPVRRPRGLQTSGGLGTMGFGLPAAIGAALALAPRRVVCVSGDGSMLMNLQELATLAELNLNVSAIVMNNRHLGLVRQQQELFYAERYHASRFETEPDFAAIARGFGVRALDLAQSRDPSGDLASALSKPGPCLIDAPIHHAENVFPMVPPGGANRQMIGGERPHAESRA